VFLIENYADDKSRVHCSLSQSAIPIQDFHLVTQSQTTSTVGWQAVACKPEEDAAAEV